jgi:hypothetical protein
MAQGQHTASHGAQGLVGNRCEFVRWVVRDEGEGHRPRLDGRSGGELACNPAVCAKQKPTKGR